MVYHFVILATRYEGVSLFGDAVWPKDVHVAVATIQSLRRRPIGGGDLTSIAWAELYQDKASAVRAMEGR